MLTALMARSWRMILIMRWHHRLDGGPAEASQAAVPVQENMDTGEYTPTSPAQSAAATTTAAAAAVPAAADTAAADRPQATAEGDDIPWVPSTLDSLSEPSEEKPAMSIAATPHAAPAPASEPPTPLDPQTAAL